MHCRSGRCRRIGDDAFCASLYDEKKHAMLAEYRRLLYVALTRAEDRLYICGATGKEKISEQSWYHLVKTGLTPLATEFEMPWGKGLRIGKEPYPIIPVSREAESQDPLRQIDCQASFGGSQ